jgi:hypothetical protein
MIRTILPIPDRTASAIPQPGQAEADEADIIIEGTFGLETPVSFTRFS